VPEQPAKPRSAANGLVEVRRARRGLRIERAVPLFLMRPELIAVRNVLLSEVPACRMAPVYLSSETLAWLFACTPVYQESAAGGGVYWACEPGLSSGAEERTCDAFPAPFCVILLPGGVLLSLWRFGKGTRSKAAHGS